MVHLWDRGGTHETARGGFFGRKNAKKLTFFAKKQAKKKKIKKIKGGFFSSWGFTNKKTKIFFFFFGSLGSLFWSKNGHFLEKNQVYDQKISFRVFFLKKCQKVDPPKIGHFRGGLLSSLLAKKPSKRLKMHFSSHKGEKIFIIQPLRGLFGQK